MRKTLWGMALLAAASLISFRSTYEPDLWWHLAQGREVASGHLVRSNLFSPAYRDYPQYYTSWLFDVSAYALWTRIGPAAIQTAQALTIAATLAAIAAACRLRASTEAAVAVCAIGWTVLEPRALPRPHVLSFLGLAACVYCIERARARASGSPLLWVPVIVAVWSNLHLECVFGVALIALFGAAEWLRPGDLSRRNAGVAIAVAVAALVGTAANPYGIGLLRHTVLNASVPQFISIAELQPPYLPNYAGFYAWLAITVLLMTLGWRRVRLFDLVATLLFAAIGVRYLRLTPLLFVASAPLVARELDALSAIAVRGRAVAIGGLAAALLLSRVTPAALIGGLKIGGDALEPPDVFSEPAMRFARMHDLDGPAFTSFNLGGYVAWKLYPAMGVFVDSRLQAYPPAHFRAIRDGSFDFAAWDALTSGVDVAVISRTRINPLSGAGRFDPALWAPAYQDQAIEILVRRSGPYGRLAEAR